ncbi:MAG: hypothetical protein ACI8PP_002613 [Candidatus Pseudothioglobus sp.]|jgi:hypothetical protein
MGYFLGVISMQNSGVKAAAKPVTKPAAKPTAVPAKKK